MVKFLILNAFTIKTSCGVADNIWDYGADGHAFESRIIDTVSTFFIFQLKNLLRSNLKFSTSYGRSTDF